MRLWLYLGKNMVEKETPAIERNIRLKFYYFISIGWFAEDKFGFLSPL